MRIACLSALLLMFLTGPTMAAVDPYPFDEPKQQERFQDLLLELRCLVCQNQSLSDSDADLAQDLRKQVYEMISEGRSDGEIVDYMVARYGEFVRYRPGFDRATAVLWLAPAILLLLAALTVFMVLRKRGGAAASLSTEEALRLQTILDSGDKPS